ncbi:protein SENSITIVE TO UV 2 isoform X1 [Phragmites australis]|uniref:protein SENSITIVE TO UV 2 isoform X1 n=1 Tax=Phragmites australis TaxID=29695 RepID=UPI002D76DA18|nr:protein SENSITIVE TO UV 2 isoform X1 [Phragmites australis]
MDGGLDGEWEDESFLEELFRAQDEAVASHNPNPTPTPTPAPAPVTHDPAAAAPISYLPAATSYPSPALRFSPPRELTQRPPLPLPPAAASYDEAMAMVGRDFSPPRELSQRPAVEDSDCAIVVVSGPAGGDRFMSTGGGVGAKRGREAREVERLKRELNRVSKQMNDLKNECTELRKDRTRKDLQIKAKEAEIQNLKKANLDFAGKDVCGAGMDIDQSVHVPANGALHAVGSWASTRTNKSNRKVKEGDSFREDLCLKQRHQTDLPEALELKHRTMIDNTTSTSGGVSLEESAHLQPRSMKCQEIKAIGVQTDNTLNSEHLDYKKVLVERISSNLRAIWGMPTNSLSGRNLISKIIVSCSEEILALLQCTRLTDECGTSSEARSSMDEAISEVYDMFIKMSSEKIPIQTFLEALLNLCSFDNAAIVGRTLRILHRVLQPLLNYGTKSNGRNNVSVEPYVNMHMENNRNDSSTLLTTPDAENLLRRHNMSLPFTFWSSVFTQMLQIGAKHSEESIRVDALSIMILIVRTTDPIEERQKFAFTSVMERLHRLLQKENGSLVKKHSVRLLFLLLNCPAILKLLCSGGKDGSEQMESEGIKNDRSKQAVSSVLEDLSECLTCEATCSLGIELCRLVIILLAYIASSGKLGYEVLLGPVTARGTNFLELIMEVLASQMHYETLELLKERCLLMREALILLNRLASHANFSKPTLEVLTSSKLCATLTIDVANRLPQTQMANDLAELAQKFRLRVYGFLEEKPLTADGSNPNASRKISNFQEQQNSSVDRSIPR